MINYGIFIRVIICFPMTSTTSLLTPYHTVSSPGISVFLLLFSLFLLQNHCCHSNFSKIFFIPLPWGLQNEVRFLHRQNLFLISIYIFLLFSTCTLRSHLFLEYASFILTSLSEMFFPVSLMRELFFQGIRKLKYLYSFSFQSLRA